MIESSIYDNYKIDFSDNFETNDESYYFIYNTNRELYLNENLNVPQYKDELSDFCINFLLYIDIAFEKLILSSEISNSQYLFMKNPILSKIE